MRDAYLTKSDLMYMFQIGVADTGSGTLFGGQHRREFQKSRLTLVIAAGGSGITAIRQAMAEVNRKLDQDYSSYVKFLAIDSWEHELEYVKKSGGDTLNITSPMAVIRFTRDRRSDFYKRFISANFPVHRLGDGEYGRQIKKVKFYDIKDGSTNDQLLIDIISEYFTGDWAAHKDLPVDILIVSGLGGDMGSGTFIDIAVRAKQACPIPANVTVYGYLMLPDIAEKFIPDNSGLKSIYRNGFAALKELESYESILFENDRKEFFPAPCDKNNVVITDPIFDYPVLISGDYNKAIALAADAIVMTVAGSSGKSVLNSLYGQRQAARQIKLAKDKVSRLGILNPDACPEDSHMYCGFGHARASIPEKIVIPHVIGSVSRKLYEPDAAQTVGAASSTGATYFCTKERSLSRQDYQNAMHELLGLTKEQELKDSSLWIKLDMSMHDFDSLSAKVIENEFASIIDNAQGIMKKYGPRVIEYLYDGTGNPDEHGVNEDFSAFCLKTQIEFVKNRFSEWKEAGDIWQAEFVDLMMNFLRCTSRFADVLEIISNYYEDVGKSLSADDFREFEDQSGNVNEINLCRDAGTYAWVKERVSSKLANIKVQDVRDELVDDFFMHVSSWISNKEGVARNQFDEVMSRVCKVGKYAGENDEISFTITDYFNHVIEAVPEERQQIEINKAVDLIFEQLMMKSKPCLKVKKGTEQICSGAIMIPRHLYADAIGPMIEKAFRNKIISTSKASSTLMFPYDDDSIACYQISAADALSDLEDLTKWENAYDVFLDSVTHLHNGELPTLHMETGYSQYNELTMKETAREKHLTGEMPILSYYEARPDAEESLNRIYGTGLAWKHYPSINAARYGNSFDGNGDTGEADYRSGLFTEKINEAMRVGVIECVREGNTYKYFINLIPRDWTNFSIRGYRNRYRNGLFVRGKELFDFLANQNREVATDYRKQIFLSDSEFFGKDGFDFTEAIRVQGWNQERIDREHKAYMMRVMRKSTGLYQDMEDTMWRLYPIEYELEKKEVAVKRRVAYKEFLEAYLDGLVNSDERGHEWTAIIDENGDTEYLCRFSKITLRMMDDFERKALLDGFKLKLVYDSYEELRSEIKLTSEKLAAIRKNIFGKLSIDEREEMLNSRITVLQDELQKYEEKYGCEAEPEFAIMEAYELEDDEMEKIESIAAFYKMVREVLYDFYI